MATIRIFHTHIEVYPYEKGEQPRLEKIFSTYDPITHAVLPIGYYILNDILYLPRGASTMMLAEMFQTSPEVVTKCDPYTKIKKGVPKFGPKSTMQKDAIDFLCSQDKFAYTSRYSQYGLNLQTGDGKTYAMVCAILKYKIKAIIVTHQDKIKKQWIKTFDEMTTFPTENLVNISGTNVIESIMKGKISGEIYLVNHQTLEAYAREKGWSAIRELFKKIKVGIKVVDEAHRFFEDTLMLDNFSNCFKSFYLTATYGRSDSSNALYKRAFSSLIRFGEETINYEEKRKHTNFIVYYFKTKPHRSWYPDVKSRYGFSSYKYIDYELKQTNDEFMYMLFHLLDSTKNLEGKTLIFSPKIDSVEYIANRVSEYTGKEVGIIHSNRSAELNQEALQKDIISTTIKSAGEGLDIKGLRILICLEPIGSSNLADQVRGRLREYSPDKDTYMFYPVDVTIPETTMLLKRILPTMKKKCKEIMVVRENL